MRIAILGALVAGCYLTPSERTTPRSPEGVQLTLVGDDCEDHLDSDADGATRQLAVQVRIDNPTDQVLRVAGGAVRLTVGEYSAAARDGGTGEVRPHGTAVETFTFVHPARCDREREFVLRFDDALLLGERAIAVASLPFKP